MKATHGQDGFALTVVLIFVLAIGMGTALVLPRALRWQHAAIVQQETDCLLSDLRLLQQMTRTSSVYPVEETVDHEWNDAVPELEIREAEHAYMIWRKTHEQHLPTSSRLLRHAFPSMLTIRANIPGRIRFGRNGGTTNPTTIYIYYDGERADGKKIILDSVGRIRVEGIDEQKTP